MIHRYPIPYLGEIHRTVRRATRLRIRPLVNTNANAFVNFLTITILKYYVGSTYLLFSNTIYAISYKKYNFNCKGL